MGQDHQEFISATPSKPTSLTCPSFATSRWSSPSARTRLPAHPSTQAAKAATGDSAKWHMSPKPLTWQRGSLSPWQWLGQSLHCGATHSTLKDGRRGTGMSLPLSLSHSLTLPFSWSLHPAFYKLCTPIYTQLCHNDFNAMCLSSIERERESSVLRGLALLSKCTFIATKCLRVLIDGGLGEHAWNRHDVVGKRQLGSSATRFGSYFHILLFFYCANTSSYLSICEECFSFIVFPLKLLKYLFCVDVFNVNYL